MTIALRHGQELRTDRGSVAVSGYAAVYNEVATIGGQFREKIAPGAFRYAKFRDTVLNINHAGLPLARTRNGTGTLDIIADEKGLFMQTELDPSDPQAQTIISKLRRGDISQMSFAFWVRDQEWDDSGELPLRIITQIDEVSDVSLVTRPAYRGTSVGLRYEGLGL